MSEKQSSAPKSAKYNNKSNNKPWKKKYDKPKTPKAESTNAVEQQHETHAVPKIDCQIVQDRNRLTIKLENKRHSDDIVVEFCVFLAEYVEQAFAKAKKIQRLTLFLQGNSISDDGTAALTSTLLLLSDKKIAYLDKLYLFNNAIADQGCVHLAQLLKQSYAPMRELHLSHNKISTKGAMSLFDAIREDSRYPFGTDMLAPLWLRLEYNYVDTKQLLEWCKQTKVSVCLAPNRKECGPKMCCSNVACKLHLYVFNHQYSKVEESVRLKQAKKKVQEAKSKNEPQSSALQTVPMYIFLDTNAILCMNNDDSFSFDRVISKAKQSKFGDCFQAEGDKVVLVICDTVMQELDNLKKNPKLLKSIVNLQSETGYLNQCADLNILELLGAHQGEHLIKERLRFVTSGIDNLDHNQENDRKIIDVALFWDHEIGETGNVIFLSNDNGAVELAKRHGLPAIMLKEFSKTLAKVDASATWTASLFKSCMASAYVKAGKLLTDANAVKPQKSVYADLAESVAMVTKLTARLKELNTAQDAELLAEADEGLKKWNLVLQQRNPVYNARKLQMN